MNIKIGTAGWSIPRQDAERFPSEGTSLERYAARFAVAEINSSFHRPHRLSTWERWRDSVPAGFRFAVKLPKTITHQNKLQDCDELIASFLAEAGGLGEKLSVLLVQLPPKLAYNPPVIEEFFRKLKAATTSMIVCEPRHPSWFESEPDSHLTDLGIARVAADPAICGAAAQPGGWLGLSYWRLHGSPAIYRSSYADRLEGYADRLIEGSASGRDSWCIFDNTASSAAASDALSMLDLTRVSSARRPD